MELWEGLLIFLMVAMWSMFMLGLFCLCMYRNSKNTCQLICQVVNSVQSRFLDISMNTQQMIDIATSVWKLKKKIAELYNNNPAIQDHKALDVTLGKLANDLDKMDISIVDYTDMKYNDGMNVEVISIEKEDNRKEKIVKETITPSILYRNQLLKKAKVILLSGEENE